ncbi:MAG: hypothetical protein M3373_11805 [Gemmatimonadota bacterium]|nr:hypothetical protein [Gemmatimonadota bacterium]
MYSTCIFCNAPLGRNEAIEAFQVGRRLAFDAARGRLWVVCRRCEKWNLSPVEERWEAVEACERAFRETRLRVSTENIGLAKVAEGLELVRVGAPARPEFAAWRYGDQFGRRRRKTILKAGLGIGAIGALVAGGVAAGIGVTGVWWWLYEWSRHIVRGDPESVIARVPVGDHRKMIAVRRKDLLESRFAVGDGGGRWRLLLQHTDGTSEFQGETAVHILGLALPQANRYAGSRQQVADAVHRIEKAGTADEYVSRLALVAAKRASRGTWPGSLGAFQLMPDELLALEMATHEESERRALEGELAVLEQAWREAEEIAHIADNLLLPAGVQETLRKLRRGSR